MKKLMLLIFILITISARTQAQSNEGFVPYDPVFMTYNVAELMDNYSHHVHRVLAKDNSIAGSPNVFDTFRPGIVYSKKEKAAFNLDLNINAYTNLFEFLYKGEVYEMPNFAFDSVVIGFARFIPVSIVEDDRVKIFSMEVIDSDAKGNYLLKKYIIQFVDFSQAGPYQQAERAHFKKLPPAYYLYSSKNELVELNNLKKLSTQQGMPSGIDSFVKKNKLNKNKVEDLRKIFEFVYNPELVK